MLGNAICYWWPWRTTGRTRCMRPNGFAAALGRARWACPAPPRIAPISPSTTSGGAVLTWQRGSGSFGRMQAITRGRRAAPLARRSDLSPASHETYSAGPVFTAQGEAVVTWTERESGRPTSIWTAQARVRSVGGSWAPIRDDLDAGCFLLGRRPCATRQGDAFALLSANGDAQSATQAVQRTDGQWPAPVLTLAPWISPGEQRVAVDDQADRLRLLGLHEQQLRRDRAGRGLRRGGATVQDMSIPESGGGGIQSTSPPLRSTSGPSRKASLAGRSETGERPSATKSRTRMRARLVRRDRLPVGHARQREFGVRDDHDPPRRAPPPPPPPPPPAAAAATTASADLRRLGDEDVGRRGGDDVLARRCELESRRHAPGATDLVCMPDAGLASVTYTAGTSSIAGLGATKRSRSAGALERDEPCSAVDGKRRGNVRRHAGRGGRHRGGDRGGVRMDRWHDHERRGVARNADRRRRCDAHHRPLRLGAPEQRRVLRDDGTTTWTSGDVGLAKTNLDGPRTTFLNNGRFSIARTTSRRPFLRETGELLLKPRFVNLEEGHSSDWQPAWGTRRLRWEPRTTGSSGSTRGPLLEAHFNVRLTDSGDYIAAAGTRLQLSGPRTILGSVDAPLATIDLGGAWGP